MIAVIIPVHDEEATLRACLLAVLRAGQHIGLAGETVQVIVVLDSCTDGSGAIADALGVQTIRAQSRNVGAVRAIGAAHAIEHGARWLANTDADTVVAADWLWQQLRLGTDVVCGTVAVDDWTPHGRAAPRLRAHFARTYNDADGHRHIHGANLGVSTVAYRLAGGFAPLACSEDVALLQALLSIGASIAWTAAPRVVTSARINAKAANGFGDTLCAVVLTFDASA